MSICLDDSVPVCVCVCAPTCRMMSVVSGGTGWRWHHRSQWQVALLEVMALARNFTACDEVGGRVRAHGRGAGFFRRAPSAAVFSEARRSRGETP